MSTNITANASYNSEFHRIEDLEKLIDRYGSCYAYEFDITLPNGEIAGKVGDTNAPLRRQMEWAKVYKDWFKVKFRYLGTTDIDKDTFFRDYAIHAYGKQHFAWKQVPREDFPEGTHYTQEAYYGANAENVADAVKQLREGIRNGQITAQIYRRKDGNNDDIPTELYVPRANQQVCIDNIMNSYFHGRHHLLCAAYPRFGKSFTALYALDALGEINFVMIVSAVADAHDEWKDTVNLPNFRNNWIFLDSKDLANGTGHDIADAIEDGKKVVLFCTLQDIEGDKKKTKHAEIYKFAKHNSFLIVDETHNGGRGITFSKKIKRIGTIKDVDDEEIEFASKANETATNFGFVNQLHLSGTPYRILLTDEFAPEDIVYIASYSDLLAEKHAWFNEHVGEDEQKNPYYEFPERYNFVYDLNQIPNERLKQFIDENGVPRLSDLFAVIPGEDKFEHEDVVRSFIKAIWGGFSSSGCWGFLVNKTLKAAVKKFHILMKLPSIAACDAFAELVADCDEFTGYAVIRATSNRMKNPTVKSIKSQIKRADESDETTGTLTLTCQRLSAAVSVKQWNVAINAADGRSAQDYDQFTQRVCTPYVEEYVSDDGRTCRKVVKPNVFVIDLVPDRILSVAMQAAIAKCAACGVSSPSAVRAELDKDMSSAMTFFISNIESMKQVTAVDVMDMAANYANTSTIDIAVAKIPFCASLFDGDMASVMNSLDGISSSVSFETKVYEGADDTKVPDKSKKLTDVNGNSDSTDSTLGDKTETGNIDDNKLRREQMAKQRAFFARLGYLAVLANRRLDSIDSLLDECDETKDGRRKLSNVIGLSMDDCRAIATAVKSNAVVRMATDNLVYNLTRRMNDASMTNEQKLAVFAAAFSKLGDAEVVTPSTVADFMCSCIDEDRLYDAIGSGSRIIDFSSETGEFSLALLRRFEELGVFAAEARDSICAITASPLAYECTRKAYELIGLSTDNIYRFTVYDLLDAIKSDNGELDESATARISDILKQVKKPYEISLDDVTEEGTDKVNVEAIVGNPPYQINTIDKSGREQRSPVYNLFIDIAANLATTSILITPARFLVDGGKTPHSWNIAKLNDSHFSIVKYYAKSSDVFPDVDIKGGVVVTKNDSVVEYEPILQFIPFPELDSIARKVAKKKVNGSLSDICVLQNKYDLNALFVDYPNLRSVIGSNGSDKRMRPNAFVNLSAVFHEKKQSNDDIMIHGLMNNKRTIRYINRKYLAPQSNFEKYKVLVPTANGSGAIGEKLSTPLIGTPLIGYTQTFISFGSFETVDVANNCMKYIKSKFARTLLGILKVTQNNSKDTWRLVPLQDFTSASDIDWSQSIDDIDEQLYSKYNLTDEEIEFIERNIQPMD